jgi:hypothetical protein
MEDKRDKEHRDLIYSQIDKQGLQLDPNLQDKKHCELCGQVVQDQCDCQDNIPTLNRDEILAQLWNSTKDHPDMLYILCARVIGHHSLAQIAKDLDGRSSSPSIVTIHMIANMLAKHYPDLKHILGNGTQIIKTGKRKRNYGKAKDCVKNKEKNTATIL